MIILSHKKPGLHPLSLKSAFLEKPQGGQIDPTPTLLGLNPVMHNVVFELATFYRCALTH